MFRFVLAAMCFVVSLSPSLHGGEKEKKSLLQSDPDIAVTLKSVLSYPFREESKKVAEVLVKTLNAGEVVLATGMGRDVIAESLKELKKEIDKVRKALKDKGLDPVPQYEVRWNGMQWHVRMLKEKKK